LRKVELKVVYKVEKYIDLIRYITNLIELINKILDNKLKKVIIKEIIVYSDILQKILFKNIATTISSDIRSKTRREKVYI
jgi:hypothetical protein